MTKGGMPVAPAHTTNRHSRESGNPGLLLFLFSGCRIESGMTEGGLWFFWMPDRGPA